MEGKKIAILGLGWLGLPLAKSLIDKGYKVNGSVTSNAKAEDLRDSGIDVSVLNLFEDKLDFSNADFFNADVLIINFPPRRVEDIERIYPNQVKQLLPFIQQNEIKKVVFVSSTSVYPEVNGTVNEEDDFTPDKPSGRACLNAENVLRSKQQFSTTVIRFGGLIGADRNPHRFMQRGVRNGFGEKPVNLIHLDDCIGLIEHVIDHEIWNEVINGCCPVHPTRKEFYDEAARVAGVEKPLFENSSSCVFKEVSSEKLTSQLGYTFKFESPIDYLKSLITS